MRSRYSIIALTVIAAPVTIVIPFVIIIFIDDKSHTY